MFQFKINHPIQYTRDKLFKAKITDSDSCHVCALKQTLEHLFVECPLLLEPFYLLVER